MAIYSGYKRSSGAGSTRRSSRTRQSNLRNSNKNFSSTRTKHTSRGNGKGRRALKTIDISSFINKAVVSTEVAERVISEHSFNDFDVDTRIKKILEVRGYTSPTPIQDKTIPHILRGKDVVGLANTGTGKTAAFLIPLIDKVIKNKNEQVLILAPTRELAIQIEAELKLFTRGFGIYSTICVGGAPIGNQIRRLRQKNHFIIGTPGRTIDLIKRGVLKVNTMKNVVLDEADRMLDMGFIADIRFILEATPSERQTVCFSATMAPEIKKLVSDFLTTPVTISVKTQDVSKNINQDVVRLKGRNKVDVLAEYLTDPQFKRVFVFGRTKYGVEALSKDLNGRGFLTESIHGNKTHPQRQRALKRFKEGSAQALIATDVAARGLDISGVTHVINVEMPETYDDYIHRIGRTGRGVHLGQALTFVN